MSDPYIPAEDRIDVIGRLTARLDDDGQETLREKAAAQAEAASEKDPGIFEKPPPKEEGKDIKDFKDGKEDKDGKETKDLGEKDSKDVKDDKDGKDVKETEEKDFKDTDKDGKEDKDDKDFKEHKDGDEKDPPEKDPKDEMIEKPVDLAASPEPERQDPGRPVM